MVVNSIAYLFISSVLLSLYVVYSYFVHMCEYLQSGGRGREGRARRVLRVPQRRGAEHERDPVLQNVQPGGAPGVLRRAVRPGGPVALPPVPRVALAAGLVRAVQRAERRVQAHGGGGRPPLGAHGVRLLDPGGLVRQRRLT